MRPPLNSKVHRTAAGSNSVDRVGGAAAGDLDAWRSQGFAMFRSYRTDYLLWGALAGGVFVALGFADLFPIGSMWGRARSLVTGNYGCATGDMVIEVGFQAVLLGVPAAAVGWVGHAAAVLCGLRLSGRAAGQAGEPVGPPGLGATGDYAEWAGGSLGAGPGQLTDGWGPDEPGAADRAGGNGFCES